MSKNSKPVAAAALVDQVARAYVLANGITAGEQPDTFIVPSTTSADPYTVAKIDGHLRCTCSGYRFSKSCQHVGAVAIRTDLDALRCSRTWRTCPVFTGRQAMRIRTALG